MHVKPRKTFWFALLALLVYARSAAAEPVKPCTMSEPCHLRMREDTTLQKDNGDQFRLPPGHFFDEPTFQSLDLELHRLQDQETRLTAENKSLKTSMDNTWTPGWFTLTVALLVGAGGGVGGYYWYTHR